MFAGGGSLPQWIEISNGSRTERVNLSDWTLTVENATADADVSVGAKAVFTIPEGTRIDPSGQHTLLRQRCSLSPNWDGTPLTRVGVEWEKIRSSASGLSSGAY